MTNNYLQSGISLAASLALATVGVGSAEAASISGLFTTGVDSNGDSLSLGSPDPHYVVVETNSNAVTLLSLPGSYLPNNSSSLWIWENSDGQPVNTTRTFRTTFDLSGLAPNTAIINGQWAADNFLDDVLINGVSIGAIPNDPSGINFVAATPFTINSGFLPGLNTLDFVVRDVGSVSGFRIVALSGTVQPSQPIPEPLTLLGAGVAVAFGAGFKRRKSGNN